MQLSRSLTERRVRGHATILALVLWIGAVVNLSTPGVIARNGHPKGEDFLHFWTMARLVQEGEVAHLYEPAAHHGLVARELPAAAEFRYLPVYGPQVALAVSPLGRLPYLSALLVWTALMVLLYAASVYLVWRRCPQLHDSWRLVALLAAAFPPFWYLLMYGQSSGVVLLAFVGTWLALEDRRLFLAGLCLGLVCYKPQLGIAAAAVFVFLGYWRVVAGAATSIVVQYGAAYWALGGEAVRDYIAFSSQLPQLAPLLQPELQQMHSLRSFFQLLAEGSWFSAIGYSVAAVLVLGICLHTWRKAPRSRLAYVQLLLATVLVSPHVFVYDLVLLAPALLLLEDSVRATPVTLESRSMHWLVYLAYALPLLGPLAGLARLQLSVPLLAILAWRVHRMTNAAPSSD